MSKKIDISVPISEICEQMGVDPRNVAELVVRPTSMVATIYNTDVWGQKYVDPETGEPAWVTVSFEVAT